jgi:hypothetical protein
MVHTDDCYHRNQRDTLSHTFLCVGRGLVLPPRVWRWWPHIQYTTRQYRYYMSSMKDDKPSRDRWIHNYCLCNQWHTWENENKDESNALHFPVTICTNYRILPHLILPSYLPTHPREPTVPTHMTRGGKSIGPWNHWSQEISWVPR